MIRIRFKVLLVIASVAISSIVTIYYFSETSSKKFILKDSFNMLKAIRETKANQIESYFHNIENQLTTFSEDKMVIDAMREFKDGINQIDQELNLTSADQNQINQSLQTYYEKEYIPRLSLNSPDHVFASQFLPSDLNTKILQYLYITSNPHPVGEKDMLEAVEKESSYSTTHKRYHKILHSFQQKFGYYDLFLVEMEQGRIVYSVFKEIDFGTSLLSGPHQESKLAEVFKKAKEASFPAYTRLIDFSPYKPSYNAPASFIASPIFDGDQKIGVLIFQMPADMINRVMTHDNAWEQVGLGKSGETYLVGHDYTLRNQSRFLVEAKEEYLAAIKKSGLSEKVVNQISNLNSAIGLQPARTPGVEAAIKGESGETIIEDYRGIPVLSAYSPVQIKDVNWAIMSEIDQYEALEPLRKLRMRFLLVFLGIIPLIIGASYLFARSLTSRIQVLKHAATELADGNLNVALDIKGEDEIGSLAGSFEKMRVAIRSLVEKQTQTIDALSAALIPLTNDIGLMILIGSFDEHRVRMVRKNLTEGLYTKFQQVVILDVTSIPSVDFQIAEGLIKIAKAAQLMGSTVILSGIHAEMAIEITDLDLNMEGILTRNSLQMAIHDGMQIVKK